MTKERLGAFIAENRRDQNMTQRDLAERLHITDKAVSKWERGLSYPDVTLLEPLAEVFGLGVEELVACRRAEEKKEEEQPVKSILEISRENRQSEQRKMAVRAALSALVMAGLALLVVWYSATFVHEQREKSIFLKETVGETNYLYLEQEGHLLRLKCGDGVDFDAIELTDGQRGDEPVYRLNYRWNKKTYQGTVTACEKTGLLNLGGLMNVTFETESAPLFGHSRVYYTSEDYYPDPYGEPRGKVYLCNYRFWTQTWDEAAGEWVNQKTVLLVEDCLAATVTDMDQDGKNEVIVRTRWPEKPYAVYKELDGEIVRTWPEEVPEDIRAALRCIWEE